MKQILHGAAWIAAFCMGPVAYGQATNAGDIRGSVTDSSGALVPDVNVTVKNLDTGVERQLTTNRDGLYDTSSIVVGTYSVKFTKDGFQTFERTGITLQVGFSTVNAVMKVGSVSQEVVVNTDIPLLTTEAGEQSTTFSSTSLTELPNVSSGTSGPDWESFTVLLPGSAGAPQGANSSTNPGQVVAINGNLPYSNVLADGASSTLSHSANADVSVLETISELQVNTSAFSAQYGIGGVIFNQISKGGTSNVHGSLYEYFQTDKLNAFNYGFRTPSASLTKSRLRYHDFGGTVGGPLFIPKLFNGRDKAFFFFGYDQIVNHGTGQNSTQTVPTEAVKGGDFSGQPLIYDPTTQTIGRDSAGNPYPIRRTFLSEYGTNAIPAALFDKVSANFQKLYPTPANHLAGGQYIPGSLNNVGLLQNNFISFQRQSTPVRRYFGRFDYNITPKHRLSMSDTQRDVPVVYPASVTPCPIACQNGDVDSNNAQITEVWTISSRTINEARMGFTYQGNFFTDQTIGQGFPAQLGWQFAKADSLPSVQFNGAYPYTWINPASNAVYKEQVFDPSDVVTMIRGKHVLHFGGEFLLYDDNSTAWGNVNAGTLQFNGSYTRGWAVDPTTGVASTVPNTGLDYADFLLGRADSWGAGVNPEYGGRLKSPQVFVQDDYKVRPNLTVNLGLRYQIRRGWTETHGNMSTFDPTVINPATNTPGAIWYGTTQANGRSSLQAPEYKTFLPRVGFSWLPHPDMTIRGGFGIYAYNLSLDNYGGDLGQSLANTGGYSDQTNGITPVTLFGGTGTNLQTGQALPFTGPSSDPALKNGQGPGYTQYHQPTPQIYQYNMAIQNTLGPNMVFELAYVGSHALNLFYPTELNSTPLDHLNSNGRAFRPYQNYTGDIGGSSNNGISNYNSLQTSLQRRLSHGLSFDVNYTWSHFLDSIDSSGWGGRVGNQNFQIPNDPADNYSNSNFDIRNAFKGRAVYQLPFGHGRAFMNKSWVLDEFLGGWQASTTMIFQSGNPFTVFGGQSTYTSGSGFPNYNGGNLYPANKTYSRWFNPEAFTRPADGTFGNFRRNSLYGPGVELVNISAGKTFDIHEQMKLQFRIDTNNAFNHTNLSLPGSGGAGLSGANAAGQAYTFSSGDQQINGTTNAARTVQFAAHFTF